MHNAGGRSSSRAVVVSKRIVEQLAGTDDVWAAFWDEAERVGPHFIWRGKRDRRGRPVFSLKAGELLASHLAWAHNEAALFDGDRLRPSCGKATCIRAGHQEVVRGER